jgi:hypothetical protein
MDALWTNGLCQWHAVMNDRQPGSSVVVSAVHRWVNLVDNSLGMSSADQQLE